MTRLAASSEAKAPPSGHYGAAPKSFRPCPLRENCLSRMAAFWVCFGG
jgi:hypothetical protein